MDNFTYFLLLIFYGFGLNLYTSTYNPWFVGITVFANFITLICVLVPSDFLHTTWILIIGIGFSTWPLIVDLPVIALILQLAAVLIFLAFALVQFKNVSPNCTEEHLKGARVKYLTEMSVINLGVIATINYLKGPWWASLLSNVVTIIYYFYIKLEEIIH